MMAQGLVGGQVSLRDVTGEVLGYAELPAGFEEERAATAALYREAFQVGSRGVPRCFGVT